MEVRKLKIEDLEQIVKLRIQIQDYDFQSLGSQKVISKDELQKLTINYLTNNLDKNIYLFGAFNGKKLVSTCGFYIDRHFPTYDNKTGIIGHICNVFTVEELRHKGYSKKLLAFTLEYAESMGIKSFKLSSTNKNAIDMYEKFGFKNSNTTYKKKV